MPYWTVSDDPRKAGMSFPVDLLAALPAVPDLYDRVLDRPQVHPNPASRFSVCGEPVLRDLYDLSARAVEPVCAVFDGGGSRRVCGGVWEETSGNQETGRDRRT